MLSPSELVGPSVQWFCSIHGSIYILTLTQTYLIMSNIHKWNKPSTYINIIQHRWLIIELLALFQINIQTYPKIVQTSELNMLWLHQSAKVSTARPDIAKDPPGTPILQRVGREQHCTGQNCTGQNKHCLRRLQGGTPQFFCWLLNPSQIIYTIYLHNSTYIYLPLILLQ